MKLTATKQVIIMSCVTWIVVVAYCLYHQGLKFFYRTNSASDGPIARTRHMF